MANFRKNASKTPDIEKMMKKIENLFLASFLHGFYSINLGRVWLATAWLAQNNFGKKCFCKKRGDIAVFSKDS